MQPPRRWGFRRAPRGGIGHMLARGFMTASNPAEGIVQMTDEGTIFAEALARPTPQERAAYLAAACADDPQLRARIENLLAAHEQAGSFLQAPPRDLSNDSNQAGQSSASLASPGTIVGAYKL